MAVRSSAELASNTERGYQGNPLKNKLLFDDEQPYVDNLSTKAKIEEEPQYCSSQNNVGDFQNYESLVLRKMRQAEERKRLEQEILQQDKLEEEVLEDK